MFKKLVKAMLACLMVLQVLSAPLVVAANEYDETPVQEVFDLDYDLDYSYDELFFGSEFDLVDEEMVVDVDISQTNATLTTVATGTVVAGGAPWTLYSNGLLEVGSGFVEGRVTGLGSSWPNVSPWQGLDRSLVTNIVFTGPIVVGPSMLDFFSWFTNMETIEGLAHFDTSNVTTMEGLFSWINGGPTTLDLSSWDTRNVTNMASAFTSLHNLTTLDLSGWDTSNVTSMNNMFSNSAITELDVSHFDTRNVTDMESMLSNIRVTELDLSSLNVSNVTNMHSMFWNNFDLVSLDLSGWNTSNVTDMSHMFFNLSQLTHLDISHFDTSNVINMGAMFADTRSLTHLDISNFDTGNVTNMSSMFSESRSVERLDLSHFNTSSVINMGGMFWGMHQLEELNISDFDTSAVTNMSGMFANTRSLAAVDVSNFNTSNVTDMSIMFAGSDAGQGIPSGFVDLDLSNFDTSNVTRMYRMFCNAAHLGMLDISNFDTSNVTDMNSMFRRARSLTSLDISHFDTSNVEFMSNVFNGATGLTYLDLSNFDTSNARFMSNMFDGATALERLDISSFNTTSLEDMTNMFRGTTSLSELTLGPNFGFQANANLPTVPNNLEFAGYWQNVGTGTPEEPQGNRQLTSAELIATFNASMADTFVWQRVYAPYRVTVESGMIGNPWWQNIGNFASGDEVTIHATVPFGYRFVRWEATPAVAFSNVNLATTTFEMPASDVTIRAVLTEHVNDSWSAEELAVWPNIAADFVEAVERLLPNDERAWRMLRVEDGGDGDLRNSLTALRTEGSEIAWRVFDNGFGPGFPWGWEELIHTVTYWPLRAPHFTMSFDDAYALIVGATNDLNAVSAEFEATFVAIPAWTAAERAIWDTAVLENRVLFYRSHALWNELGFTNNCFPHLSLEIRQENWSLSSEHAALHRAPAMRDVGLYFSFIDAMASLDANTAAFNDLIPRTEAWINEHDNRVKHTFTLEGYYGGVFQMRVGGAFNFDVRSLSSYIPGETVFVRWEVTPSELTTAVYDVYSPRTHIIMPAANLTVRPVFEGEDVNPRHTATVEGGTGGGSFLSGATVSIRATVPSGDRFVRWESVGTPSVIFANVNSANTSFTMPTGSVTVRAIFEPIPIQTHTVTVQGGTGAGNFAPGTSVSIRATVPSGQRFVRWETVGTQAVSFANANSANTSFTMPSRNVTVRAVFEHVITTMRRSGVTQRSTPLRTGPGSSYREIRTISGSTNVRITGRSGVWYRVVVGGRTGWVRQSAIAHTRVNAVVTTNNAHVRAGRGTSYRSLMRLPMGRQVVITHQTASWSRVTISGRTGWIRNRDLSIANGSRPGRTTANNVRVHTRPVAGSNVRHRLPRHAQLMIVQRTTDGWTQIRIRHSRGTLNGWVRTNQIENRNYNRRTTRSAPLRRGPSTNTSRLLTIPRNANVSVRGRAGNWYHVRVTINGRNRYGWLRRNDLQVLRLP